MLNAANRCAFETFKMRLVHLIEDILVAHAQSYSYRHVRSAVFFKPSPCRFRFADFTKTANEINIHSAVRRAVCREVDRQRQRENWRRNLGLADRMTTFLDVIDISNIYLSFLGTGFQMPNWDWEIHFIQDDNCLIYQTISFRRMHAHKHADTHPDSVAVGQFVEYEGLFIQHS